GDADFDGDMAGYEWTAQRGQSPSVEVISMGRLVDIQIVSPSEAANFVVLDGVIVDPITPNLAFNVYYSMDDAYTSADMSESDWEQKLWTRVPEVYLCSQRQRYAFPEPIHAKYVKIEFTN